MQLPKGHQQVTPYIMVPDGEVFIQFLQQTFNARSGPLTKSTNGKKIIHGELQIGESIVFFADGTEESIECDSDCDTDEQENPQKHKDREPSNIHMYVYVLDAVETMKHAEKAGGICIMPVMNNGDDEMGGFLDPFNNLWWVVQQRTSTVNPPGAST
ncbi:hypothetical protein EHS13_03295 [Paenibacillus psychroresistens]|uniref:VOC domain-containing protein n=1 Tax=Paenibacillus psychroresistens TaxID=1778678 RepID=A0A6B8RBR5_9BACL|nr:hypothetical protein [Paenibacillus psychroresistens]QGQ94001.1 hypothetical protein EHS13_03295 [Paenibacillus psychroresistens]